MTEKSLPSHARAVIIGGGVAGCSVAYHLARLGWTEVVLLEREQLTLSHPGCHGQGEQSVVPAAPGGG